MGSGERATAFNCVSFVITFVGVVYEAPRRLIPNNGEIDGEGGGVLLFRRGTDVEFESHTRLLDKHVKKGLAIFEASEVVGMPD